MITLVEHPASPEAFAALLKDREGFVWLDGGSDWWHVFAWEPSSTIRTADEWPRAGRDLQRPSSINSPAPFTSGVLGYVGYGAGHIVETVPQQARTPEPPVWLGRYERSVCILTGILAAKNEWVIHGPPEFVDEVRALLDEAVDKPLSPVGTTASSTCSQDAYEDSIRTIQQWISDGDCYQVNLSRHVMGRLESPFMAYRRLRTLSDAAHGAFLRVDSTTAILSNSPELLCVVHDRVALSDPIKGTRPRGKTPEEDERLANELLTSEKDHAELAMIVDLVRNDLGRVAVPGGVTTQDRQISRHANVFHTSWPVQAVLRDDIDSWDVFAAMFPPGSVTGAPKVRATERIHELENHPRGVYCGSIGFSDDRGRASWSVAIRTAVWHDGTIRYHVGGGVVADSDATAEWQETRDKGSALAEAFGFMDEL